MCVLVCMKEKEKRKKGSEGVKGRAEGKQNIVRQFLDILPFPFLSFVRNDGWSQRSNFKMLTMLNYCMVTKFLKLFKSTQNSKNKQTKTGKEKLRAK